MAKKLKQGMGAILDPAEDPRRSFSDAPRQREQLLAQLESAVQKSHLAAGQLEQRKAALEQRLLPLEGDARRAIHAGREDLAKVTLYRRQAVVNEIADLQGQIDGMRDETLRLSMIKQQIEAQLERMQAREEVVRARYHAAEAQVRLNETLGGARDSFAEIHLSMEEAELRTGLMQARAEAVDELLEAGVLDAAVDLLPEVGRAADEAAVEAKLAALKGESE